MLRNFGLTNIEADVYFFLSKHGAAKCSYIAKQINKDKGQIYQILRRLQNKMLVESTLESPVQYTAVAFERVVESAIKEKREEAELIEGAKQNLVDCWKNLNKNLQDLTLDKFAVIKNRKKINRKIYQMINETNHYFFYLSTVSNIQNGNGSSLFDSMQNNPNRSNANYRILIELTEKDLASLRLLLKLKPRVKLELKGRTPSLVRTQTPGMVIRDGEELVIFINSNDHQENREDVSFWTNSKVLIQSFLSVFKEMWQESSEIEQKICEIEAGKISPRILPLCEERMKELFEEITISAKEEIMIVTSEKGLTASLDNVTLVKDWVDRGILVKIMAPITNTNFGDARQFSNYCEVGNIRACYLPTVLVDGQHLFQAKDMASNHEELFNHYDNAVYSDDYEILKRTKNSLDELWKQSLVSEKGNPLDLMDPEKIVSMERIRYVSYQKMLGAGKSKIGLFSEKDLINKIVTAQKMPVRTWKDTFRWYGSHALGIVHCPSSLDSDIVLSITNANKQSSFGEEDLMIVYVWRETANAYIPSAVVIDNRKGSAIRKQSWAGSPAEQNFYCVKKDQLEIRVQGNTLFACWTLPINLSENLILPPASILFESYGKVQSVVLDSTLPSSRKVVNECNRFEAKASFREQGSRWSLPATDGMFSREIIINSYPPSE